MWGRGRVTGVLAWRLGSCEDRHPFAPPRTCSPLGPHISLVSLRGRPALGALLSRSWSLGGDPPTLTPTVGDGGVRRVCVGPSTRLKDTCGWNWRGGRAVVSRPPFPHPHGRPPRLSVSSGRLPPICPQCALWYSCVHAQLCDPLRRGRRGGGLLSVYPEPGHEVYADRRVATPALPPPHSSCSLTITSMWSTFSRILRSRDRLCVPHRPWRRVVSAHRPGGVARRATCSP